MSHRKPDIRPKRIYDAPNSDDGARILVDRLWPRGVGKDKAKLTCWLKEIAPSPELREWFNHLPSRFAEFSIRYRVELSHNKNALAEIDEFIRQGRVTLLYAAHDLQHNHALVLAEYLKEHAARHSN